MAKTKKAKIVKATKPKIEDVVAVIEQGIQNQEVEGRMTETIKRDLFTADKRTGQTIMTRQLNKFFASKSETEERKAECKKWVRTRLQTLIKEKSVQELLLGDDVKIKTLTIKKVNNGVLNSDRTLNKNCFTEKDLGQFRVIQEAKKPPVEKSFEEELNKLMEKHNKHADDLVKFTLTLMTPSQIIDEIEFPHEVKEVA